MPKSKFIKKSGEKLDVKISGTTEDGSNGSGMGVGNTETPIPSVEDKKKRDSARLLWFFTWHCDINGDWFQRFQGSDLWSNVQDYVFGKELGEEGETPHIQGFVRLKKKVRLLGIKKKSFNDIHWEVCRCWKKATEYCMKEGDFVTNMKFPRKITFDGIQFDKWWQLDLINMAKSIPDDRTVCWYWSIMGSVGKSKFTTYMYLNHDARLVPGKAHDAFYAIQKLYEEHKAIDLVIMDIPRALDAKFYSYGAIEAIKNGLVVSGKYEGCACVFANPHLVVFSNMLPEKYKLSSDRWKIVCIDEWVCYGYFTPYINAQISEYDGGLDHDW